jgi:hypothetical protein
MEDTPRSQTISPKSRRIAHRQHSSAAMGQQSYAPNGVSPVWFAMGVEPMVTEEPDEGNLHVRIWGAADKAAILRVEVPPYQLPDSGM